MRIKLLMFVASTIMACGCASASSKEVLQTTQSAEFSEKCGITLALPADLFSIGQGTLGTCVGSYDTVGGTVLSLAPIDSSLHDPSWMDRIPTLHIRRASINAAIQKNEEAIFHGSPTRKTVIAASAPMECNLTAKTTVEKIYDENWHGWLAEDIYKTQKNMHPPRTTASDILKLTAAYEW
ncbi:hypothetical protein [Paraburkholderia sp. GAS348]|uniref:hypothetical protein n=1 Tax=Paraburkholderia sp. GAS348 TaxID=3035132 RepID=UPI003D1CE61E